MFKQFYIQIRFEQFSEKYATKNNRLKNICGKKNEHKIIWQKIFD